MMNDIKKNLDRRICDVERNAQNEETYREFLVYACHEVYGDVIIPDFDAMSDEELRCLIDDLDYLLEK